MAPCYFPPKLPIREVLRSWLDLQKVRGMHRDVAGLIWLLAIEVDEETLAALALPVITTVK